MCVNEHELDFHPFGNYTFYVNGCRVADIQLIFGTSDARLRKPGKIRRQLKEYAVVFYASDYSGHCLPHRKERRIFFPCAEQLLLRKV